MILCALPVNCSCSPQKSHISEYTSSFMWGGSLVASRSFASRNKLPELNLDSYRYRLIIRKLEHAETTEAENQVVRV